MSAQRKISGITGITRQDGSYLAESLVYQAYEGHGIKHRSSSHTARFDHSYHDRHETDASFPVAVSFEADAAENLRYSQDHSRRRSY